MQNTTLTRYQLSRKFISTVNIALLIYWYLTVPGTLMLSRYYGSGPFELTGCMALFSPAALLLCWPLMPVLAHAMSGRHAGSLVSSARDLRSLLIPGAAMILFLHSLMYLGFNGAYLIDMLRLLYGTEGYLRELFEIEGQTPGILDIIFGFGMRLTQSASLLLVGLIFVAYSYLRSPVKAIPEGDDKIEAVSVSTITRLQLASGFIYASILAVLAHRLISLPFDVVQNLRSGMTFVIPFDGLVALFTVTILLLLPFGSIVSHAMTGEDSGELVVSVDQIRALIWPCAGMFATICLWCGLPLEVAMINRLPYSDPFEFGRWDQNWFIVPVVKNSLVLALVFYPSIRDLVRQTVKRPQ